MQTFGVRVIQSDVKVYFNVVENRFVLYKSDIWSGLDSLAKL